MHLDLSETETAAIIHLLKRAIADDRYPFCERVQTWQCILDKLEPRPGPRASPADNEGLCAPDQGQMAPTPRVIAAR